MVKKGFHDSGVTVNPDGESLTEVVKASLSSGNVNACHTETFGIRLRRFALAGTWCFVDLSRCCSVADVREHVRSA